MRVCLVCEGSYPYIQGGVSSWVNTLCKHFADIQFSVISIVASKEISSSYAYGLPPNVDKIHTICLEDIQFKRTGVKVHLSDYHKNILRELINPSVKEINWKALINCLCSISTISDLVMCEDFYDICFEEYLSKSTYKIFLDFIWNMRGMYLPILSMLRYPMPEADIYHSMSAGYAGVLGACLSTLYDKPYVLSEHGIYTREREEDIILAQWVAGDFKDDWIDFFKKLSKIAYDKADIVTTLFNANKQLQLELGCSEEKLRVIPNGVIASSFDSCVNKHKDGRIVGTVLRVVPIKDVKTMLVAFDIVKEQLPHVQFWIMGNCEEDPTYYQECVELVQELGTKDVHFLGTVNIKDYLPEISLLLLSSISEGQPLAMLEGMSAEIPFIVTKVGNCESLILGTDTNDHYGAAGYVVPIMDSSCMAQTIVKCLSDTDQLRIMGEIGRQRVQEFYKLDDVLKNYSDIYNTLYNK